MAFDFRFPLKNPDLLQHWVHATKKDLFVPNKWSKICSNHFLPSDYRQPPGGTYILKLNSDAIPTVCLPSSFQPPVKFQKVEHELSPEIYNLTRDESMETQNNDKPLEIRNSDDEIANGITPVILITPTKYQRSSPIKITPIRKRQSIEITTPIRKMKSQIKVLQQKVRRQNIKIKNMSELFKEMKKKGLLDAEMECTITNKFDGIFLELFKNQLKNKKRRVEGQRYSHEIKQFAMTLNYYFPKAFNYCRSVLLMLLFCWQGLFYAYNLVSSGYYDQHMYLVLIFFSDLF